MQQIENHLAVVEPIQVANAAGPGKSRIDLENINRSIHHPKLQIAWTYRSQSLDYSHDFAAKIFILNQLCPIGSSLDQITTQDNQRANFPVSA